MLKLFKRKQSKKEIRDNMLMHQYEKGQVLQVDGKTDNKEYFKSLEVENGSEEITE